MPSPTTPAPFTIGLSGRRMAQPDQTTRCHPLTNKTDGNGTFAPGSTFKMVVALTALEAGIGPHHAVHSARAS